MKKFFLMCMMMLIASMCYAQHVVEAGPVDNVYANVSLGGVIPTNDIELENVRPQFSLEIGKDVTTLYTTGIEFKTVINTTGVKTVFDEISVLWLNKLNLTNIIGYKSKLEVFPYTGIGWGHELVTRDNYAVFDTGIELKYNINNTWALTAKPHIEWCHANDGLNVNHSDLGLSVGVSYTFPNRDGSRGFQICDRDMYYNECIRLNNEVNNLRKQLEECNNRPAVVKEVVKEVVVIKNVVETVPTKIQFTRNSSKVSETSIANLQDIVNSDSKYEVIGYASEEGTTEYNQTLSEKRAESVKDILVKLGVPSENITIKGKGATTQFSEDDLSLNRVVIIKK